jgi:predicted phage terminase large subunit-like protein
MTADLREALLTASKEELARRRLLDFGRLVYPQFQAPAHIRFIADLLEKLERNEIRKLCVAIPVRHGKSTICSQIFPSWYLGRHPTESIILASHSESLAVLHSRTAKHLVEDHRWPFQDVRLSSDSASVQRWNVRDGGGLYAIGVGGAITGRGMNVGIVDDALHDGLSDAERDSAWRWFTEVFVPRLEPGGRVIVIGARFASDDLIGRIRDSKDASEWNFVRLPALAEELDPLGREVGAPLWPERISLAEIEQRRAMMGSFAFAAQFQQDPVPRGGAIFKAEWFEKRFDCAPTRYDAFHVMTIDGAWGSKASNDPSAIACWATDGRRYFLIDSVVQRLEFPDLVPLVMQCYRTMMPHVVVVESAASGIPLIAMLSRESSVPIVSSVPRGDKLTRASSVTPLFESNRVWLPRSAPWLSDWMSEHLRFTGADRDRDDQVDCTSMALRYLSERNMEAEIERKSAESFSRFSMAR